MSSAAIDRVLERPGPVDWSLIRRIVRRQQSASVTRVSLKKILPLADAPLELVEELLHKLWYKFPVYLEGPDLLKEYISEVWRKVFLRPEDLRLHSSSALPSREDAESLFSLIRKPAHLEAIPLFRQAYAKTRLILESFQQIFRLLQFQDLAAANAEDEDDYYADQDRDETGSLVRDEKEDLKRVATEGSLLDLLVHGRHPNFLVYLQAILHPEELDLPDARGRLPLHLAAEQARRSLGAPSGPNFLRLAFQDSTTGAKGIPFQLLNRSTPIGLLTFLWPSAARRPDQTGKLPLEAFLTIGASANLAYRSSHDPAATMEETVEDLEYLLRPAPQALSARSLSAHHLYPFLMPSLAGRDRSSYTWNKHAEIKERGLRELNLLHTLLRANPMVLALCAPTNRPRKRKGSNHNEEEEEEELPVCTMYEGVLKKRIRQARTALLFLQEEEESLLAQVKEQERLQQELLPGT